MSPKHIFVLGTGALLLFIAFTYALRAAYPRIVVEYQTGVTGRVTGSFQTKGYHTFFLNGKTNARYDMDAFTSVEPAAELPQAGREACQDNGTDLGDYLREGDSSIKAPIPLSQPFGGANAFPIGCARRLNLSSSPIPELTPGQWQVHAQWTAPARARPSHREPLPGPVGPNHAALKFIYVQSL